jgi:uncharacterized damage-inducible protein DinB
MTQYSGWDDYQISLARTVGRLSREQLVWRPAPDQRSAGENFNHIAMGRIDWFHAFMGVGNEEFARQVATWKEGDGAKENPAELARRLNVSWQMVEEALRSWTIADLGQTFQQSYNGKNYLLTRQWVIWHVLSHDIHHGGELTLMLGLQGGIALPELGDEFGHLSERVQPIDE